MTKTLKIVGTGEIAELLEVSRQRADQLSREVGFPRPLGEHGGGRVWRLADIERWIGQRRKAEKE